ncbi:MAG: CHASE4 domain-containing protein [Hyphomonadaceae bacterium]
MIGEVHATAHENAARAGERGHAPSRMSAGARIACAIAAVFILVTASAALVLDRMVMPAIERLEATQHAGDIARLESSIDAIADDMRSRVMDYAQWTDTYEFIRGEGENYVSDNFSEDWFNEYGVDLALFVDADRRVKWGRYRASQDGALHDTGQIFNDIRRDAGRAGASPTVPAAGILWTEAGPLIYAARPATLSDGGGAPQGLVVMGRLISADALRAHTPLAIGLMHISEAQRNAAYSGALAEIAVAGARSLTWDAPNTLITLNAADGRVAGAVFASRPRTVAAIGAQAIRASLILLAGVSGLAMLALWLILRRVAIAPLRRLDDARRETTAAPENAASPYPA